MTLRVAVLPSDRGACGHYRLLSPLRLLEQQGRIELMLYETPQGQFKISDWVMRSADVVVLQKPGGALRAREQLEQYIARERADAAVAARAGIAAEEQGEKVQALAFAKEALAHDAAAKDAEGRFGECDAEEAFQRDVAAVAHKTVYEVDDDLERVTRENPVVHPSNYPGYIDRTRALMRSCRLVTTTTHYLAQVLRRVHPDVRVVPNGVDLDAWETWRLAHVPPVLSPELRIAWAASPNHTEDARLLLRPFREIARRYKHVRFVLAGPQYPYSEETGKRGVEWAALAKAIGPSAEWVGASQGIADWPAFARSLKADIWVAPLVDSRFARSKSNLKFLEGSAVGAAVVASNVEPYRCGPGGQPWEDPPLLLCRDSAEWVRALSRLIEHPDERRALAASGLAAVTAHYTAQHTADAWMGVFAEIAGRREVAA